jgi:hypothetical protein
MIELQVSTCAAEAGPVSGLQIEGPSRFACCKTHKLKTRLHSRFSSRSSMQLVSGAKQRKTAECEQHKKSRAGASELKIQARSLLRTHIVYVYLLLLAVCALSVVAAAWSVLQDRQLGF